MDVRINHIESVSRVDGPGVRTVVFFQGCSLACKGCQSRHLWPAEGGKAVKVADLAESLSLLADHHGNVTISGGEALQQPAALAELVTELRARGVKHIIVYSGYRWEELLDDRHPVNPYLSEILSRIDVLVDGRFEALLDDAFINWRGSRNQRPIDVPATLAAGQVVTLDWDTNRIIITETGDLILPAGLAGMLTGLGEVLPTRMCGSTR